MYTIDEMITLLTDLRSLHGGHVPVVIASMPGCDVYENAACELGFAVCHEDGEGGELFKRSDDDNDHPICIVF